MHKLKNIEDTIAAISTPAGTGGIGIVRLSGPESLNIAEKIFLSKTGKKVVQFKSFSVHYGWAIDKDNNNEIIDEVLLSVMRAPKSYTTEDIVEISCHGGGVALRSILKAVINLGARLAEPGEFTKRAFLNGRIDLTQAEAVLDIINSKTDAFLKVSTHQLKGDLSLELESIREELMNIYTEIEAFVNFPEDEIDVQGKKNLMLDIESSKARVDSLLSTSDQGRILKEGIKIVLCGRTNIGKSSLLNVLLKTPRAIVSDIAGTTRDTIEETTQINDIPFQIIDTAGILTPNNTIEQEAIKRSHDSIESSDLVILILDSSFPLSREDEDIIENVKDKNVLVVLNKSDLENNLDEKRIRETFLNKNILKISALNKIGIDGLKEAIVNFVLHGETIKTDGIFISNLRHIQSLQNGQKALMLAGKNLNREMSLEFVSESIKEAINFLDEITGRNANQDLLDKIFSQFCIGK
ncbi:MAG: tRNA uridine-5-carboxymethylaminomethyl(34) synthesis GTPase MnmE [Candidatus Zapsychrus exili]|nr:tRNA uridine-5-carboxymethylaminomethyl(34) synthesis GTPase MnmE [Candidatus Zapsychrus exili]